MRDRNRPRVRHPATEFHARQYHFIRMEHRWIRFVLRCHFLPWTESCGMCRSLNDRYFSPKCQKCASEWAPIRDECPKGEPIGRGPHSKTRKTGRNSLKVILPWIEGESSRIEWNILPCKHHPEFWKVVLGDQPQKCQSMAVRLVHCIVVARGIPKNYFLRACCLTTEWLYKANSPVRWKSWNIPINLSRVPVIMVDLGNLTCS